MKAAAPFPVRLFPVEYKHGKLRDEEEYEIQLCAQAMCLEEMYHTHIPEGAIFYISSHRRKTIVFTDELRELVKQTVQALDEIRKNFVIPSGIAISNAGNWVVAPHAGAGIEIP